MFCHDGRDSDVVRQTETVRAMSLRSQEQGGSAQAGGLPMTGRNHSNQSDAARSYLFLALWWGFNFALLQSISKKAVTCLQQTYFQKMPVALRKQLHAGDSSSCWYAGFWIGVTGTYPGSGCGAQPLELPWSWQSAARSARAAPTEILNVMQ